MAIPKNSSGSDSSVESDGGHDSTGADTLPTRKRKRSTKTAKQYTSHRSAPGAHHSGYNTMVPEEGSSSDTSSDESGDGRHYLRNIRQPKLTASLARPRKQEIKHKRGSSQPSRNIAEGFVPSFYPHPYAAVGKTPSPSRGSIAPRHTSPTDIAIHPLSSTTAFSTALFRDCGDMEPFSSDKAIGLLQNRLGHLIKLDSVTMKPLTPDVWFLTCFLSYPPCQDAHQSDRPTQAFHYLPSDDVDNGSSSDNDDDDKGHDGCFTDNDNDDNDNNGHLSNHHNRPSRSRRAKMWSQEEDDCVIRWKKQGRGNEWISSQLHGRSPGAVQARWYAKLRGK